MIGSSRHELAGGSLNIDSRVMMVGANQYHLSDDFVTWSNFNKTQLGDITTSGAGLVFMSDGTRFFCFYKVSGSSVTRCAISLDGATWVRVADFPAATGVFYAIRGYAFSKDGTPLVYKWDNIGASWTSLGSCGLSQTYGYTTDGTNWVAFPALSGAAYSLKYAVGDPLVWNDVNPTISGYSMSDEIRPVPNEGSTGFKFSNGVYAPGGIYTNVIGSSPTGQNWFVDKDLGSAPISDLSLFIPNGVAFDGRYYLNGSVWTYNTTPPALTVSGNVAGIYANSTYVRFSYYSLNGPYINVQTSPTGQTWTTYLRKISDSFPSISSDIWNIGPTVIKIAI